MTDPTAPPSERPPTGSTKWPQSAVRAIVAAIGITVFAAGAQLLAGLFFGLPIRELGFDIEEPTVFLLFLVVGQLSMFVVAYLYVRQYGLPIPVSSPSRRDIRYIIGGIVGTITVSLLLVALLFVLGISPESAVVDQLQNEWALVGVAVLSILVIAPVEEYLFRGVIQGRLRRTFGAPIAVLVASLLFGSVHLFNYTGGLDSMLAGTLLISGIGVVLGIVYERTGNLTVPIVVHAVHNVFVAIGSLLTL